MSKDSLQVALCQFDVVWNTPLTNFSIIEELSVGIEADLLVLPEMFSSGFVVNPKELADPLAIKTMKWLSVNSAKKTILGTTAIKRGEIFYNSLLVYSSEKEIVTYNKAHTFVGQEAANFQKGNEQASFMLKDWKISVNICYDLRFPAWCRTQQSDVMIFCANWPKGRITHWTALLKARAIENQCYVIGVNRIGIDNNDWKYTGQSVVFDFKGEMILDLGEEELCKSIALTKAELLLYRQEFPFLNDRDEFSLERLNP
jgi:omega-amidase